MADDRDDAPSPLPTRRARAAARMRGLAVDLSPLRDSRDFRLLWLGEIVSHTGRHITVVALPFQVYVQTRSVLAVGMIGLVQLVPLIVFSIVGGAVADAMDRRRVLLLTQVGLAAGSGLLVVGAVVGNPPLWFLYLCAAIIGGLTGFDAPARQATIPRLVGRDKLSAAMALNQVIFQLSDVIGPAVGGLVIAQVGLAWAYGIDVLTFLVGMATVVMMRPLPSERESSEPRGLAAIREGFAYLRGRHRRVLRSTFYADLIAMVFGMPRAIFPLLALDVFKVGPAGLGVMFAAPAVGSLIGALLSGWVARIRHQGRAVLWSIAVWGLAIAGFGLSTRAFGLGLGLLAIAGAADVVSAVLRGTILQGSVPDRLRGRLSSIHFAVVVGGPRLGDAEAGIVAHLVTPAFSVISGGLACVLGVGLLAFVVPEFRRYHAGEPA